MGEHAQACGARLERAELSHQQAVRPGQKGLARPPGAARTGPTLSCSRRGGSRREKRSGAAASGLGRCSAAMLSTASDRGSQALRDARGTEGSGLGCSCNRAGAQQGMPKQEAGDAGARHGYATGTHAPGMHAAGSPGIWCLPAGNQLTAARCAAPTVRQGAAARAAARPPGPGPAPCDPVRRRGRRPARMRCRPADKGRAGARELCSKIAATSVSWWWHLPAWGETHTSLAGQSPNK